jgi:hypothetical protein
MGGRRGRRGRLSFLGGVFGQGIEDLGILVIGMAWHSGEYGVYVFGMG